MKPYFQIIYQEPFRMTDFKEGIATFGSVPKGKKCRGHSDRTEERQFLTKKYGILDGSWYGFIV